MLSPYTGAALETYEKMKGDLKAYTPNKLYKNYGKYFFINSKGYMHIYAISGATLNDRKVFYIADYMLTKDNTLKESSSSKFFDTTTAAAEYFREFYLTE